MSTPDPAPDPTLKLGDTVRLSSGSPAMTVEYLRTDGFTGCAWFVDGEINRDAFPTQALSVERGSRLRVVAKGERGGGA